MPCRRAPCAIPSASCGAAARRRSSTPSASRGTSSAPDCRARKRRKRSVPSSRSASPTSRASDDAARAERAVQADRVAPAAAALALKIALAPLLVAQALATRRRAPVLPEAEGARDGALGAADAPTLRVLVAGDSSAAGVGVARQDQA